LLACALSGLAAAEGLDTRSCSVRDETGVEVRPAQVDDGAATWHPATGWTLRCDVEGFEPLDVEAGTTVGGPGSVERIELVPAAREARLILPDGVAAIVEWRDEPEGAAGATRLLARRQYPPAEEIVLPLGETDRVLRIVAEDRSPVSWFVRAGERDVSLSLDRWPVGGELFARLESRRFSPATLRIEGATDTVELDLPPHLRISAPGLQPGLHRLIAVYAGGIEQPAGEVEVAQSATTELLPVELEPVGAVDLALDEQLCRERHGNASLEVWSVESEERSTSRRLVHQGVVSEAECAIWLAGLRPGSYQLALRQPTPERRVESAGVEVAASRVTSVVLGSPMVVVDGRVLAGDDEPVPEVVLGFQRGPSRTRAVADADGRFQVVLPEAGDYTVWINFGEHMPAGTFQRSFSSGRQETELRLEGGVLHLEVRREDGEPIDTWFQVFLSFDGSERAGILSPVEDERYVVLGLAPGDYRVSAAVPGGWVSEAVELGLDAENPVAHAELILRHRELTLRVLDDGGRPLVGAEVRSGSTLPAEKPPGGVFDLPAAAAGEPVYVDGPPGYSAVCRRAPGEGEIVVRLAPAPHTAVVVLGEHSGAGITIVDLPGADCPYPLGLLDLRRTRAAGVPALEIAGLPAGRFTFVTAEGEGVVLQVPGPPVTLLP